MAQKEKPKTTKEGASLTDTEKLQRGVDAFRAEEKADEAAAVPEVQSEEEKKEQKNKDQKKKENITNKTGKTGSAKTDGSSGS